MIDGGMDPKTEVQYTAAGPSFLGLPPEVRNMIYRLLLVANKPLGTMTKYKRTKSRPVWAKFGKYHLEPAVLRVCLQVYQEAGPILTGENTFGIYIGREKDLPKYQESEYDSEDSIIVEHKKGFVDEDKAMTELMYLHLDEDRFRGWTDRKLVDYDVATQNFQRFEIEIDHHDADLLAVGFHVKSLCNSILRNMPALQHICIHLLQDTSNFNDEVLGPFGMLRNMRSVVIHGVPLPFAENLRELMLVNTP